MKELEQNTVENKLLAEKKNPYKELVFSELTDGQQIDQLTRPQSLTRPFIALLMHYSTN